MPNDYPTEIRRSRRQGAICNGLRKSKYANLIGNYKLWCFFYLQYLYNLQLTTYNCGCKVKKIGIPGRNYPNSSEHI